MPSPEHKCERPGLKAGPSIQSTFIKSTLIKLPGSLVRCAVLCWRCCYTYCRIERRRFVEVKQIFERVGMLVAFGQMWTRVCAVLVSVLAGGHKGLFDQSQERGVIPHGMRHIVLLGERRNSQEGYSEAKLVKVRARGRKWPGRVRAQRRAQTDGAALTDGALSASTGLQTCGRIGEISALTGANAVRVRVVPLSRTRRGYMIVRATVFVVRDEDDGVFPERSVADSIHNLGDKRLATLD